jgi:hypothetical protein
MKKTMQQIQIGNGFSMAYAHMRRGKIRKCCPGHW